MRKEQDKLKIELEEAKKRINVDTNRWSFDLYTAQSFTGEMDTWILVQKLEDPATDKKNLCYTNGCAPRI